MNFKGLKLSQADEHLYQELVRLGYPEDRIQPGYRVSEQYRSDFTVMAPGISDIPLAVFEVKEYSRNIEDEEIEIKSKLIADSFGCSFYLYVELDKQYEAYKIEKGRFIPVALPSYSDLQTKWRENPGYLEKVYISNFTVFKEADFCFGKKINLIIGENGSGKTQILKLLYSTVSSILKHSKSLGKKVAFNFLDITDIFRISDERELINRTAYKQGGEMTINVHFHGSRFFSLVTGKLGGIGVIGTPPEKISVSSVVYLPTRELLSIFPSFLSFSQTYRGKWPYDKTYEDTVSYLGLKTMASQNSDVIAVCKKIEDAVGGSFYFDDKKDRFFMKKKHETKAYEIDMTAEGWRKLGEILLLLKNGAISQGTMLFWDEPEANLNPALIRVLASVIVELGNLGVQVFLTTHSLFLLRELDMLIKGNKELKKDDVRYFNFLKPGEIEQGDTPEDLNNILLLDESLAQSDRYLEGDF